MKGLKPRCMLAAALLASGCAPTLGVTPRYGNFDLSGDFAISSTGITATSDLESAGIEEDDSVPGVQLDFKWGSPHLVLDLQSSEHGGDGTLDADISSGGVTIPAGADVSSDVDLAIYNAILTFDLLPSDFELGIGFGAALVDVDAAFTEIGGSSGMIETDETFPIPLLAARAGFEIGRFGASASLAGMSLEIDDDEGTYLDLDAQLRYRLFGGDDHLRGSLMVGYRRIGLDAEYEDGSDDVEFDVTFDGFYFAFNFQF
jgi:hypothetical protein